MKNLLFLIITFFFASGLTGQHRKNLKEIQRSFELTQQIFEKEKELREKPVLVKVMSSCSTSPEPCGTIMTGSVSTVRILEGKYKDELIYVATPCASTQYSVGKSYLLLTSFSSGSSVHLCNGQIYNSNWNYNLSKNKYFLVFGQLVTSNAYHVNTNNL